MPVVSINSVILYNKGDDPKGRGTNGSNFLKSCLLLIRFKEPRLSAGWDGCQRLSVVADLVGFDLVALGFVAVALVARIVVAGPCREWKKTRIWLSPEIGYKDSNYPLQSKRLPNFLRLIR